MRDNEYSQRVFWGGTFDPFKVMREILNGEIKNTDLSHLSIAKKEANSHLELTNKYIQQGLNENDYIKGIWKERTDLCISYLSFLKSKEDYSA